MKKEELKKLLDELFIKCNENYEEFSKLIHTLRIMSYDYHKKDKKEKFKPTEEITL
jgi:hypothetical protein